ncbi:MAG TPA: ABC transporter permease [Pirellula sp.]|nr:ABC transporter permease [Pirellula sp.]
MIWTIIQTSWRRLRNNRSELFLTFIVPMVFFSIFALIFGSRDASSSTPKIKVAISNEWPSELSNRTITLLQEQKSLRIAEGSSKSNGQTIDSISVNRMSAEDLVRRGMVSAAVVFTKPNPNATIDGSAEVEILTDSFDQVASQVLTAVVQRAVMTANAEITKAKSTSNLSTPTTSTGDNGVSRAGYSTVVSQPMNIPQPPTIATVDIIGGKKANPVIAMYAAGIAVMFLLFSATTASGSLLEERENSTLDRLLCSRLNMDQLLLGKWAYLTIIGSLQMTLMFLWGAIVFGIDLQHHVEGFIAMTIVTAGAASSFALMLAALCKSRMQLGWVSTIVILTMSALGGSMVPRYLMSESIQKAGLWTFNAWALDGYNKIFWRELPLKDIGLELAVLAASGFVFIVAARVFAIRWERS